MRGPTSRYAARGGNGHRTRNPRSREGPVDLMQFDTQAGHDLGQDELGVGGVDGKGNQPQGQECRGEPVLADPRSAMGSS